MRRINNGIPVCGQRSRRWRRRRRRNRLDTLHIFRLRTKVKILLEKASPRIITEDQTMIDSGRGS